MESLMSFSYEGVLQVRTVDVAGEPWFVASDIAKILGYRESYHLTRGLDDDEKGPHIVGTPSGDQEVTVISESGLYSAILRSRVEGARQFKRWVTHEVLPQIRKTGGYQLEQREELADDELMARAVLKAQEVISRQAARIAEIEPKGEAYDAFIAGEGTYSVGAAAKLLGLSQNKLFIELRAQGIVISKGAMHNTPYQRYMRHFVVKATTFDRADGSVGTSYTTRVLPSGVDFLRRRLGLLPGLEVA